MASSMQRKQHDVMKLMLSSYEIEMVDPSRSKPGTLDFVVKNFRGPSGTPYEGGMWPLNVHLPMDYPFKSPSIGFGARIFHPNIDERSGTVCLDVLNSQWSPMYDLINIFDVFLPQLLTYGNPADPLNGEAALLMNREPERFRLKVREYVSLYAAPKSGDAGAAGGGGGGTPVLAGSSKPSPTTPASTIGSPSPMDLGTGASATAASASSGSSSAVSSSPSVTAAAAAGSSSTSSSEGGGGDAGSGGDGADDDDDVPDNASDVSDLSDL